MKENGGEAGRNACGENAFTYMYSRKTPSRLQKQSNVAVRIWWAKDPDRMVGRADRNDKVWRGNVWENQILAWQSSDRGKG